MDFPIYHGNSRSLKKTVLAAASGRLGEDRQHRVVVQALRDVSFTLQPGDRLALVGGNGAGKTTLLRALAGIYEPVVGRLRVDGAVGSLLDVSSGMNSELSGRENIMLRGLYNGMRPAAITPWSTTSQTSPIWASSWSCPSGSTRPEWPCAWPSPSRLRSGRKFC